jgi:cyclase
MKVRVIPTILTDGLTVVKGERFNNWRTVGSAEATAQLYSSRDVDELMFLDVTARSRRSMIELNLLSHFANVLDVPFSVGGGINSLEEAKSCFRYGAEKIVIGTAALRNPKIITQISEVFGNQAVVVAIDFEHDTKNTIRIESGSKHFSVNPLEFIRSLEQLGAGEILLQSINRDGTLSGLDINRIIEVCNSTNLPVIASGGAGKPSDFLDAFRAGASAVAAGAIFQFTENTPSTVRAYLRENGIAVREIA